MSAKPHRKYTKGDKATALTVLTSTNDNITQTSKDCEIPASTLRKWRDGHGIDDEIRAECDIKRGELSGVFERVARLYLNRAVDASAINDTKGKDAVIAAATATDKMQLLRGRATSIAGAESDLEEARHILEWHRQFQEEDGKEKLSDAQVFEFVIKRMPRLKHLTAKQLEIKGIGVDEAKDPSPES